MAEVSTSKDITKSIDKGLLKSFAGLLSAPEEIYNLAGQGGAFIERKLGDATGLKIPGLMNSDAKYERTDIPFLPSYDQSLDFMRKSKDLETGMPKVDYESQTSAGKIIGKGVEYGTGGGLFTGFKKAPTIIAGLSGTAAQGVEETGFVSEGQGWKVGLAIDIIGNVATGMVKPNDVKRLQTLLKDLENNGQLKEVQEIITLAQQKGINLTVPEAIAGVTNNKSVMQLADNVASTEGGGAIISAFTKNRFPQLSDANRKYLNDNFGNVDIDGIDPKIITDNFVNTLVKAQDDITIAINKQARNLKNGGWAKFDEGNFSTETMGSYMQGLVKRIQSGDTANVNLIKENILNKITTANKSDLGITNLKTIYDEGKDIVNGLYKEGKKTQAFKLDTELKIIRQVLDSNEYYKRASEFTARANKLMADKYDALSIGGQINPKNAPSLDRSMNTIRSVLFDENVSYINIQKLYKELNKIDKSLFPEVSQMLFAKNFSKVMTKADDPLVGLKFYNQMMGKNVKLTEQMVKGSAIAQGKNPEQAWKGFSKMMLVYKSSGMIPKVGSPTASRQEWIEQMKQLGIPLENVDITRPASILQTLKNNIFNKRVTDLANAFVSPNGLEELIKISKASSLKQIQANMNALLGIAPLEVKNNQTPMDQEKMIKKNELELSTGVR